MSLEGQKGLDKKSHSGLLEAGAFAAALLGAIDHGPAQALEIPPGTSWNTAITQNVRNAVMKEPKESAASFIKFTDEKTTWPNVTEGNERNVDYDPNKELLFVLNNFRGKSIEVRCDLHLHQKSTLQPAFLAKLKALPYLPPSIKDVNNAETAQSNLQLQKIYALNGMPVKRNVEGNADPRGIWYQSPTHAHPLSSESKQAWQEAYNDFVTRGAFDPNFDFTVEYQKLQRAYRVHLKAEVRFVPYEEISHEPACAGVDYKPNSLRPNYDVHVNRPAATPQKKGPEIIVRPPEEMSPPGNILTRPSLGEIEKDPKTRRRLDDQNPPLYRVGPPQR